TNVPTLAERGGDFSAYCLPAPGPGCPFVAAFGGFIPFLPPAFQHPVGAAIAGLYPAPNRNVPGANFVSSPTQRDDEHHFDLRLDHVITQNSHLTGRYSFSDRDFFEPFPGSSGNSLVPGYGNSVPRRAQNLLLGETHTFSPNFLNEFRFSFGRVANRVNQQGQGTSTNAQVGLPDISSNSRDFGLSLISLVGYSTIGNERVNPQRGVTNTYQFLDQATWVRGRHEVRFGFDFRKLSQDAFRDVESRGFLTFFGAVTGNPVADLLLGIPTVSGVARIDNPQRLRAESYNVFVNDSWKIRPNVTLTAGLRYEFLSPPVDPADRANIYNSATGGLVQVGTNGVPRAGYFSDKNNFGPRIGLAWTLPYTNGNTVVRAGYGAYFDQSPLAPGEGLYFSQPYFDFHLFFLFTGLPPLSLSNPWPINTFPLPTPPSATAFQRDLRTPYTQHWSLSVQQRLGNSRVLEVAYAGSKGTRLLTGRDSNQPVPRVTVPNLRPNPLFDDVTILESRGNSTYNSLQARFQQNLNHGLTLLSSYTLSKSLDDASGFFSSTGDPNYPQDSNNAAAEHARSNFDMRHHYSLSFTYDLPSLFAGDVGGHVMMALFNNWHANGILQVQSGRPFTVALQSTLDQSNTGRTALGFGANDRPNVTGNPEGNRTETAWFNTAAFSLPAFGSFGNAGRNLLTGPGSAAFNFSLLKNIQATERVNVQFRTEFFNLFNRTNYDLPDNFFGSPTFGQILSAGQPRRVQFGLKLLW
ncbi:MAG: TonB-dependent receptor, partial [Acidobacteria bacterium]|nr:TonB-dependent receptor [Acidobacteriota bacterium]